MHYSKAIRGQCVLLSLICVRMEPRRGIISAHDIRCAHVVGTVSMLPNQNLESEILVPFALDDLNASLRNP